MATRYTQPQAGPFEIDWGNPLTRGLLYGLNGARPERDLVQGRPTTLVNSPPKGVIAGGVGPSLNGSNQSISTGQKFTSANGTIFFLGQSITGIAGSRIVACQASDDAGNNIGLGWQTSGFRVNGVAVFASAATNALSLAGTWGSAGIKSYSNGVLEDSNASTAAPTAPAGNYYFELGCFSYSGGRIFQNQSTPLLFLVWTRALSAVEITQLSANPWQLFQAPRRVFRVSGGGTPATVTPAGVQSAASVGTPVATGSAVAKPSGVQAASATGTPTAKGTALASPAGVQVASATGTPVASAGTAIPATAYPVGFQVSSAVGLPLATGAALAITGGVSAAASVGTPLAFGGTQIPATVTPVGVSALAYTGAVTANGAAVALPGGVQVIGNVGALIATGEAWCYPIGVQAAVYVGAPTAYIGFIEVPGAMAGRRANVNSTRPLRIQTSSRPAR